MLYEIKLSGAEADDGSIELGRLIDIAQSLKDISAGALQVRLLGASFQKGRKSEQITKALKIRLSDLKQGSTVLELKCEPFIANAIGQQGNLYEPELTEALPNQTPIGLFVEAFKEALEVKDEYTYLDKPLLKKLKSFEKIFLSASETITFTNQGSLEPFELRKKDFKKINVLEESIPEPQEIIVNGVIDELKYTKSRVGIAIADGIVNGVLSDEIEPDSVSRFWGKKVTISGRAHYQPNGKISFVFIERLFEPSEADNYFSKGSLKETVEQQIQRQLKAHKGVNRLNEIVGQWPGDETIEEILNGLD